MQIKLATIAALLASVASPALASSKGAVLVNALHELTGEITDSTKVVEDLNLVTFAQKVGTFAAGYKDILNLKNKQNFQDPQGIDPSEEPEVCNAFITLAEVEKTFLQNVIGKYALFDMTGFKGPVGQLLRADEQISEVCVPITIHASSETYHCQTNYFNILGLVPSCKSDVKAKGEEVSSIFTDAVQKYAS
ncbi:uncharacterized protein N7477_003418 [Penicillium maclennaniae]|uniref:uncharacterized protein n=1 Tax=Penicillium maclennaniae TaxID=1343394 RepID=UPI0025401E74|nr:uncharacterized protein N7477_003418 [Penicillium maclennaniae]KAJ5677785.1 hypothetical protein N7477_003418 [Penicillium maclennaniae]